MSTKAQFSIISESSVKRPNRPTVVLIVKGRPERVRPETEHDRFADGIELAMTGVVMTGVLLFSAGLLHFGLNPGGLRDGAVEVFYALASLSFAGTVLTIARALFGRK